MYVGYQNIIFYTSHVILTKKPLWKGGGVLSNTFPKKKGRLQVGLP